MYTKEEIKQKYNYIAELILERAYYLIKNNDNFKSLDKVYLIEADIKYFFDKTKKEIIDDLEKELSKYENPNITHQNNK